MELFKILMFSYYWTQLILRDIKIGKFQCVSAYLTVGRGFAKLQLNDKEGALKDFNGAVELQPDNYGVLNNRANLYMSSFGDFGKAMQDLNQAIQYRPNEYVAYKNRGYLKVLYEDFQGAVDDFKYCLQLLIQISHSPEHADLAQSQIQEVKDLMKEALEKLRDNQGEKKKQRQ